MLNQFSDFIRTIWPVCENWFYLMLPAPLNNVRASYYQQICGMGQFVIHCLTYCNGILIFVYQLIDLEILCHWYVKRVCDRSFCRKILLCWILQDGYQTHRYISLIISRLTFTFKELDAKIFWASGGGGGTNRPPPCPLHGHLTPRLERITGCKLLPNQAIFGLLWATNACAHIVWFLHCHKIYCFPHWCKVTLYKYCVKYGGDGAIVRIPQSAFLLGKYRIYSRITRSRV